MVLALDYNSNSAQNHGGFCKEKKVGENLAIFSCILKQLKRCFAKVNYSEFSNGSSK